MISVLWPNSRRPFTWVSLHSAMVCGHCRHALPPALEWIRKLFLEATSKLQYPIKPALDISAGFTFFYYYYLVWPALSSTGEKKMAARSSTQTVSPSRQSNNVAQSAFLPLLSTAACAFFTVDSSVIAFLQCCAAVRKRHNLHCLSLPLVHSGWPYQASSVCDSAVSRS